MIVARLAPFAVIALLAACSSNPPGQTPDGPSTASPDVTAPPDATAPPDGTASAAPSSTASAAPTTAPTGDPAAAGPNADRGMKLFEENNCTACHGTRDKPKKNIYALKWTDERKANAVTIIKKGKSPMPGYADKLSDADIADLVSYLSVGR